MKSHETHTVDIVPLNIQPGEAHYLGRLASIGIQPPQGPDDKVPEFLAAFYIPETREVKVYDVRDPGLARLLAGLFVKAAEEMSLADGWPDMRVVVKRDHLDGVISIDVP